MVGAPTLLLHPGSRGLGPVLLAAVAAQAADAARRREWLDRIAMERYNPRWTFHFPADGAAGRRAGPAGAARRRPARPAGRSLPLPRPASPS